MKQKNRRRFRSHFVNHELRLRLVLDDVLFALVAALGAIGILYYLSNREIGDSMWSAHLSIKETRELLTNGVKIAGAVVFVSVLIFGFWSMLDAHRIAGPMHRLKRLLDEIGAGDLTHEIKFRKKDEFQDVAAATNALVERFSEQITEIQRISNSLEAATEDGSPEVKDLVAQLKTRAGYFKTGEIEK